MVCEIEICGIEIWYEGCGLQNRDVRNGAMTLFGDGRTFVLAALYRWSLLYVEIDTFISEFDAYPPRPPVSVAGSYAPLSAYRLPCCAGLIPTRLVGWLVGRRVVRKPAH